MSDRIKILVVGQTPPPQHGQAIMIDRLLRGKFERVKLYHVRMAFSDSIDQVGRFRIGKLLHLLGVIVRIAYFRIAHGVNVLYYPPAGPNLVPMYRDLIILSCTRWMFRRTIFHFHAGGISELYPLLSRPMQWLFRRALFQADAAIRVSHGSPEDAKALCARREYIVPNGIDDEWPRFAGIAEDSRHIQSSGMLAKSESRKLASNQDVSRLPSSTATATCESAPLRILFIGILRESKGLLDLLDACGLLAARGVPFQLDVVGQFQSPQFEKQVRAKIDELGIERHVAFLGVLSGDAKWLAYAGADVFCLPTFYEAETFAIVLVEALSFGLPVVATRWRGIPEIIDDGANGFLVEPHDSAAVADRLEQLQNDAALRNRLGRAGREKFLSQFTAERFWQRMEDVFVKTANSNLAKRV